MTENLSRKSSAILLLLGAILVASLLALTAHPSLTNAVTGVPRLISHQGRLLDSNGNLLGGAGTEYCFKFSIWDDAVVGSGSKLWPSGAPGAMDIIVRNGVFNSSIGDTASGGDQLDFDFESNREVYLQVEVAAQTGGTCGDETFETLEPRQRIMASGYAINAATLRGFTASQSADLNEIPVLTNGDLILGDVSPAIRANGSATLTLQEGVTGNLRFFNASSYVTSAGSLVLAGGASISTNIELTGYVDSNWRPLIDNTYTLGDSTHRWANLFSSNASISNNLEVSGIASVSQLYVGGTLISSFGVSSNSLDFDEFVDNMTLDANLTVASAGYSTTWNGNFSFMQGNVGIASASPEAMLAVDGTIIVRDLSAFGDNGVIGGGWAPATVNIGEILDDELTGLGFGNGIQSVVTANPSSAPADYAMAVGGYFFANTETGNAENWSNGVLMGAVIAASQYGTGSIPDVTGLLLDAQNDTGTVTDLRSLYIQSHGSTGGGTTTNSYGIYLDSPVGGASVTNHYGIYLANQTTAGGTLNYALYSAGSARSYFGGNVGIGTTLPEARLEVSGTASISGATTLRGLTYTWPSTHGSSGYFLQNNGSGTLSWTSVSGIGVASDQLDFDEFKDGMTLDASTTIASAGFELGTTANFGIGTTNPTFTLDVRGTGALFAGGYGPSALGASNYMHIGGGSTSPNAGSITWGAGGGWKLNFGTISGGAFVPLVTYMDTGNVGIGTITPTALLHVVGDVSTLFNVASGSNSRFAVYESGNASLSGNFELSGTVSSNLVPTINNMYNLGSSTNRWSSIYVSSGSFHIGRDGNEAVISYGSGSFQGLLLKPNGTTTTAFFGDAGNASISGTLGVGASSLTAKIKVGGGGLSFLRNDGGTAGTIINSSSDVFVFSKPVVVSSGVFGNSSYSSVNENLTVGFAGSTINNTGSTGTLLTIQTSTGSLTGNILVGKVGGTTRFAFNASASLGIGDATPDARLEVVASMSAPVLALTSFGGTDGDLFKVDFLGNASLSGVFELRNTASISGATTLAGLTYTWPSTHGSSGYFLQNNGSGTLSWTSVSGIGVASDQLDFDEFKDGMTLDADTTIASNGFILTIGQASISEDFDVAGHAVIGNAGGVNRSAFWGQWYPELNTLTVAEEVTSVGIDEPNVAGISNSLALNLTDDPGYAYFNGSENFLWLRSSNAYGIEQGIANGNYLINESDQTVNVGYAAFNQISNTGFSGHINTAYGTFSSIYHSGGGTISDAFVFYAGSPGGGNTGNQYGLYIENQSDGGVFNGWNIYSAGVTSRNYFEGNVGIGVVEPETKLELLGTASISGATTLRGVTYTWPSVQGAANTYLKNDGSGNLTWATIATGGVTSNSLDFDEFVDSMTLDANTTIASNGFVLTIGQASISNNFEVSGIASVSQLYVGGVLYTGGVSWPLLAPNGSASAPSYSFADDPDAGLFRSGNGLNLQVTSGPTSDIAQIKIPDSNRITLNTEENFFGINKVTFDMGYGIGASIYVRSSFMTRESTTYFKEDETSFSDPIAVGDGIATHVIRLQPSLTSLTPRQGIISTQNLTQNQYWFLPNAGGVFALSSMSSNFEPLVTGMYTLGKPSSRWLGLYSANASISSALEVSGTASISGATTLRGVTYTWPSVQGAANTYLKNDGSGNLTWAAVASGVASNSLDFDEFVDSMTLDANLTVASAGYTVAWGPRFASSLIPASDNTYDLGTPARRWRDLYLSGTSLHIGSAGNEAVIMYDTSGNALNLRPDGSSTLMTLQDSGNVGIGTTSTAGRLHVVPLTAEDGVFVDKFNNASGGRVILVGNTKTWNLSEGNGVFRIDRHGANAGSFEANNFSINTTGNVGIGTTNAEATLEVVGVVSASAYFGAGLSDCDNAVSSKLLYDATTNHFLCGEDQSGVSTTGWQLTGDIVSLYDGDDFVGIGTSNMNAGVKLELVGNASVSGGLYLGLPTGNLGIGTTNPGARLQIDSAGGAAFLVANAATNAVRITPSNNANTNIFRVTNAAVTADWLSVSANGQIIMNGTGNVGIGNTTPQTKLDVSGTASVSALQVAGYGTFGGNVSVSGAFEAAGAASASALFGAGLQACAVSQKLVWDNGIFSCATDQTGGGSGANIALREGYAGAFINFASVSFDEGKFNLDVSNADARLTLDWGSGGPASLSQSEVVLGSWRFIGGASISPALEVSGSASISSRLTVFGQASFVNASGSGTFEVPTLKTNSLQLSSGTLNIGAFTLGGAVTGNSQNLTGLNNLTFAFGSASAGLEAATLKATTLGGDGVLTIAPTTRIQLDRAASSSANLEIAGFASASAFYGAGLTTCSGGSQKLLWSDGLFSCGTDQFGSGGGTVMGFREGFSGPFTNFSSVSFDAGKFNLDVINEDVRVSLDWGAGGPASLSENEAVTGRWHFLNGASLSGELAISGGSSGLRMTGFASISGALEATNYASASRYFGANLTDCDNATNDKLLWDASAGRFSCGVDQTGGSTGWSAASGYVYLTTATDNVGIGTSAPVQKLQIKTAGGNALQYAVMAHNPDATNGGGSATGILFAVDTNDYGKGAIVFERKGSFGTGDIHILQNPTTDSSLPTLAQAVMTIRSNGNVGIGSTAPARKLDVNGSFAATSTFGSGLTSCSDNSTDKLLYNSTTGQFSCGTDQTGSGASKWTDGGATTYLTETSDNVGIGTTTAPQKLTIRGDAGNNDLMNVASSDGSSIFFIDKNGNVGIGMSAISQPPISNLLVDNPSGISIVAYGNTGISDAANAWGGFTYDNGSVTQSLLSVMGNQSTPQGRQLLEVGKYGTKYFVIREPGVASVSNTWEWSGGQLKGANGTEALPFYTFTGAGTTGFSYSTTYSSTRFSGGGTSRLAIHSSGYVCFADSTVCSPTFATPRVYIEGAGAQHLFGVASASGTYSLYIDKSGKVIFGQPNLDDGKVTVVDYDNLEQGDKLFTVQRTGGPDMLAVFDNGVSISKTMDFAAGQLKGYNADTVTAPFFTWDGDADTGMYRAGAGIIGFTTDGTEGMRIDPQGDVGIGTTATLTTLRLSVMGGNVGIGTTNGAAKLTVRGQTGDSVPLVSIGSISTEALNIGKNLNVWLNPNGAGKTGVGQDVAGALEGQLTITANDNAIGNDTLFVIENNSMNNYLTFTDMGASLADSLQFTGTTPHTYQLKMSVSDTAAAPGYTWNSDTGTGMFRAGTSILGLTTAGVERMRILANGNVGIGTTTPTAALHIVGDNATLFNVASGTNSRFAVLETGNVGIGTTSPVAQLDISSATGGTLQVSRNDTVVDADEELGRLDFWTGDSTVGTNKVGARILAAAAANQTTAAQSYLAFLTTGTTAGGSPVERMRIMAGGNVGIGTTTAGAILDVNGDVIFRDILQAGGTATVSYSRFGTGTTNHSLTGSSDLLISDDLEVNGVLYADTGISTTTINATSIIGTTISAISASISGNFEATGIFKAGNGSAGAPSYTFINKTNTGMYLANAGSGYIGFSSNGSLIASVRNDGLYVEGSNLLNVGGNLTAAAYYGGGLTSCAGAYQKLQWSGGSFSCGSDQYDPPDLAENFFAMDDELEPGDLVVAYASGQLDFGKTGTLSFYQQGVVRASGSYHGGVIGVISTHAERVMAPFLGEGTNKDVVPVVVAGRVPVKVTTANGPIKVGDRIVSSDIPGVGMKSTRPGMTVGIALEPTNLVASGSVQTVIVLISPSFWVPAIEDALADANLQLESQYPGLFAAIVSQFKNILNIEFAQGIVKSLQGVFTEVQTDRLCVGQTCVTEQQLIELLDAQNVQPAGTPGPTLASTPEPSPASGGGDESGGATSEPTPTPDESIAPTPEEGGGTGDALVGSDGSSGAAASNGSSETNPDVPATP